MKSTALRIAAVVAVACLVAAYPSQASASIELGFYGITNNIPADVAIAEAQMSVEVSEVSGNASQVLFTFRNTGTEASSITDIYFDDGALLGIASIDNGDGVAVSFSQDANPGDLPGGGKDFNTTAGFSADSDPAVQPNGVNPGESVGILFNLIDGQSYDDVLSNLSNEDLRIGIHVQGFADDGSESLVNNDVVPEPSTILIWSILGGLGFAVTRWRRKLAGKFPGRRNT